MKWTGREAKADRDANAPPDVTTLAAFPAGRRFSSLAFACGGKQIGFLLDGVVGVMSADGTGWRGLSGPLPLDPVPPEQGIRSHRKQTISLKSPGGPLHASGGFISCLSHDEKGAGRIIVCDLSNGGSTVVKPGPGNLQRAFLID